MIGILHLSDIHFVSGLNTASSKVQQIKGAVQSESHDLNELLLVISGDVAYSGKQIEYSIAIEFISELEKALRSISGLALLGTVVIPGNHDLDFDDEGSVRPVLLSTISDIVGTINSTSDLLEQMTKVQSAFFKFQGIGHARPPSCESAVLDARIFFCRRQVARAVFQHRMGFSQEGGARADSLSDAS